MLENRRSQEKEQRNENGPQEMFRGEIMMRRSQITSELPPHKRSLVAYERSLRQLPDRVRRILRTIHNLNCRNLDFIIQTVDKHMVTAVAHHQPVILVS